MGSPLGLRPTLAYAFFCYHEKVCLQNCPSELKPVIYRRQVLMIHSCFFTQQITSKNFEII